MSTQSHDEIVVWRGLRFRKVKTEGDELVRYRCDDPSFMFATLWQWKSGQWGARFEGGTYSIESTEDRALVEAARKAVSMLELHISRVEKYTW